MKNYVALVAILAAEVIPGAYADESIKPLGVKVHVTAACKVSTVESVPENSAELVRQALSASGPVRERCHKRAVWKIDVDGAVAVMGNDKNRVARDRTYIVSSDPARPVH